MSRRHRLLHPIAIALLAAAWIGQAGRASATGIADDFESYTPGTFPSPLWRDVGTVDPRVPFPPSPSATVVATTDASGNPTQAVAVANAVTWTTGVYQPVDLSTNYSLAADIRIDQYSNNPLYPASDWAMQLTFAQTSRNLYDAPQAGIYASSSTGGWRLFLLEDVNNLGVDLDLGVPATLGTWYRVAFALDATNGSYRARISDIASSTSLVDQSGSFAGWSGGDGQYDAVAFFDGEDTSNPDVTISNLSVVDNVNIEAVPEPSVALLLGLGLAGLARARRS